MRIPGRKNTSNARDTFSFNKVRAASHSHTHTHTLTHSRCDYRTYTRDRLLNSVIIHITSACPSHARVAHTSTRALFVAIVCASRSPNPSERERACDRANKTAHTHAHTDDMLVYFSRYTNTLYTSPNVRRISGNPLIACPAPAVCARLPLLRILCASQV